MPRGRKPTRKGLIKKLDKLVSEYVVARDGACVICGSRQQLGCGHFFSRTHYATRWDLMNCHASCWPCNFRHELNTWPYTKFMLAKYGKEAVDKLNKKHNQVTKITIKDLEGKINGLTNSRPSA